MRKMKISVLIIDDHEAVRRAIGKLLKKNGFDVFEAKDSKTAYKSLNENEIDVAICDIKFDNEEGKKTGLKIFRYIRKKYPSIRVIMLTVVTDKKTKEQYLKEGALFYITKPWTSKEVVTTVRLVGKQKKISQIHNDLFQLILPIESTCEDDVKKEINKLIDLIKKLNKIDEI